MKVAVSIPDEVFSEAEDLAKQLKASRSEIYSRARGEFVGQPEEIKDILIKNATDLGRERSFQGGGLVDMMRAMQAV